MILHHLISINLGSILHKNITQSHHRWSKMSSSNRFDSLNIRISRILQSKFTIKKSIEILFVIRHHFTHQHIFKTKNCTRILTCTKHKYIYTLKVREPSKNKNRKFCSPGPDRREYQTSNRSRQLYWVDSRRCWRLLGKQSEKLWP